MESGRITREIHIELEKGIIIYFHFLFPLCPFGQHKNQAVIVEFTITHHTIGVCEVIKIYHYFSPDRILLNKMTHIKNQNIYIKSILF